MPVSIEWRDSGVGILRAGHNHHDYRTHDDYALSGTILIEGDTANIVGVTTKDSFKITTRDTKQTLRLIRSHAAVKAINWDRSKNDELRKREYSMDKNSVVVSVKRFRNGELLQRVAVEEVASDAVCDAIQWKTVGAVEGIMKEFSDMKNAKKMAKGEMVHDAIHDK